MGQYEDEMRALRDRKDEAFRTAEWSPIPAAERAGFLGLSYFPVDPEYRRTASLHRDRRATLEVPLSTGGVQNQTRVGTFTLLLPEGEVRLAAFESEGHEHGALFVPFRDATSGKETYGGGRYLEAQAIEDDRYLLDLNLSYHPYCVYSEEYACPLPPPENWTQVPIRAGERLPEGA